MLAAVVCLLACFVGASPGVATSPRSGAPARIGAGRPAPAAGRRMPAATTPAARVETPGELAFAVRSLEELGAYGQAADKLGALRRRVTRDADLDLWWAIDLARSGEADSAARILASPLLETALHDTADARRFRVYGWRHEGAFLDGRFDGWHWYVARARAETYVALGRWSDALEAARACTRARPLAGFEWYLRALCAARAGRLDEALDAADRARRMSPTLPEARYLAGLFEWRAGRRASALAEFRAAIELDSTYRAPALAVSRARLPVPPDTLPARLLDGLREAALLTSPLPPKYDDFTQMDGPAVVAHEEGVRIPDSLAARTRPFTIRPIVLVDPTGRIVFQEDPWTRTGSVSEDLVGLISDGLRSWRFNPATRQGRPAALWVEVEVRVGS